MKIVTLFVAIFYLNTGNSQTFFSTQLETPIIGVKPFFNPESISVLTPAQAQTAFELTRDKSGIEFRYPQGNCHGRAFAMSLFLQKNNFSTATIWNFAPNRTTLYSKDELKIKDPNHIKKNDTVTWGYHVAPILFVNNGTKLDTIVIDPSINTTSYINYHDWLSAQNCKNSIFTFTNWRYYLFNSFDGQQLLNPYGEKHSLANFLPNIITGGFYYLNNDKIALVQDLTINEVAFLFYENEIRPNIANRTPTIDDYIKLVEAVKSFESVFRYGKLEKDCNIDVDFVVKYSAIIKKYKDIYENSYKKWKSTIDTWAVGIL